MKITAVTKLDIISRLARSFASAAAIITMVVSLIAFPVTSQAGTCEWTGNGPEGGYITAIAIDPVSPSIIYVGTEKSGMFKSTDGGANWTTINSGLGNLEIKAIEIIPTTPSTLHLATSSYSYYSIDSGSSWYSTTNYYGNNICLQYYGGYVYSGTSNGRVLCTNGTYWEVFHSSYNYLPGNAVTSLGWSSSTLFVGTSGAGIYRESWYDWTPVNTGLTDPYVTALLVDSSDPNTIYAGTAHGGIFKTTNGAGYWVSSNTGLTNHEVTCLAQDPVTPSILYAATRAGLFKSTDSGAHWGPINSGVQNTDIRTVTIGPATSPNLFAGSWGAGIYKSTDAGTSWALSNGGLRGTKILSMAMGQSTPYILYAGSEGAGIFKSGDLGQAWTSAYSGLSSMTIRALALDPVSDSTVYAGTAGEGVFKSTDSGTNWSAVNSGLDDLEIYALAVHPLTTSKVYAGTLTGLHESSDGGATWIPLELGVSTSWIQAILIDPVSPTTIYTGGYDGVFKSEDGGLNWNIYNMGLWGFQVRSLAIDPSDHDTVYAATNGGIFKSTDGGNYWNRMNYDDTLCVAVDHLFPAVILAGTQSSILKSDDGGASWISIGANKAYSLAVLPSTGKTCFAGTDTNGVMEYTSILPTISGLASGCKGSAFILSTQLYDSYQWYKDSVLLPGANLQTYSATASGLYRVEVTKNGCLEQSIPHNLTIYDPVPVISGPIPPCTMGQMSVQAGFSSYQWYRNGLSIWGATTTEYTAMSPGTYTVRVTDEHSCIGISSGFLLYSVPVPVITGPTEGCGVLTLSTGDYSTYQWFLEGNYIPGSSKTLEVTQSGTYSVQVTTSQGCTGVSAGYYVTVHSVAKPTISTDAKKDRFWSPDGDVLAMEEHDGVLYLGGSFTKLRPYTGGLALLSTTDGQPDTSFPQVEGSIYCVISDGSGGWFVGGSFSKIGGYSISNLAHMLAGYKVDPDWTPNPQGSVNALALKGDTLFVGGTYSYINNHYHPGLAAIHKLSGNSMAPHLALDWGAVYALLVSDNTLYIGGDFWNINGSSAHNLAAYNLTTSELRDWQPNPDSAVYCISSSTNRLLLGGQFSQLFGQEKWGAAAFSMDSGALQSWAPFQPGSYPVIYSMQPDGASVYIGGSFGIVGGEFRNNIASVDLITGLASPWNPGAVNGEVTSLAITSDSVYAGGSFTTIEGQGRKYICQLDKGDASLKPWAPEPNNLLRFIAPNGETIVAGGDFSFAGGVQRERLAALSVETGAPSEWNLSCDNTVTALKADMDNLYIGGYFTFLGGQARSHLAATNIASGLLLSWAPSCNSYVASMEIANNSLFLGGEFSQINGIERHNLASVDKSSGALLPWNPTANYQVNSLALRGDDLYAGGHFTSINGVTRSKIATIDISGGELLPWDPNADGTVYTIAPTEDKVFIGGSYSYVGNNWVPRLSSLDPVTGTPNPWQPNPNGNVSRVTLSGNTLLAGGSYYYIAGESRQNLAAFDTDSLALLPWSPQIEGSVLSLLTRGNGVYVGHYGGRRFSALALGKTSICGTGTIELTSSAASSYQWMKDGVAIPGATNKYCRASEGGNYTVIAGYLGGCTIESDPLTISSNNPPTPVITGLHNGCPSPGVQLSTGTFLHYQWFKDGTLISGATLPSYTATADGDYTVWVRSDGGCDGTSAPFSVTVRMSPEPVISGLPSGCVNPGVSLSTSDFAAYQWSLNGTPISGATQKSYVALQSGAYSVQVTDSFGCIGLSPVFEVAVRANPTPVVSGDFVNTCPATTVYLATGLFNSYQWYFNGVPLSGATTSSYTATATGTYWVEVQDQYGCSASSPFHTLFIDFCPGTEVSPKSALFPLRVARDALSPTGYYIYFQRVDSIDGFNLYEGDIGTYYSHGGSAGNKCGAALAWEDMGNGEMRAPLDPSAGAHYYLITAFMGSNEGSSGYSFPANVEIDPAQSTCAP